MTKTSFWDRRAPVLTPEIIAIHEAAHAVVAYDFRWWVSDGVHIGVFAHVYTCCREAENTVRAKICVGLAGLLAEEKFLGLRWHFEQDIITELREVQNDDPSPPDDLRAVALALYDDDPAICINLSEARPAIAYWREETKKLLDDPRIWSAVERVAKALLSRSRGYLSPRDVRKLLGDKFFAGVRKAKNVSER
jgi:hypothetical protein